MIEKDLIKSLADRQMFDEAENWEQELNVSGDSYDFLTSVWKNPRAPFNARKRAAEMCVAYDRPKLAVTENITIDGTFADRLERALMRSRDPNARNRLIELNPAHGDDAG